MKKKWRLKWIKHWKNKNDNDNKEKRKRRRKDELKRKEKKIMKTNLKENFSDSNHYSLRTLRYGAAVEKSLISNVEIIYIIK
jgi:hypothetical protein